MDTEAQTAPETGAEGDDVHADVRAAVEALSAKNIEAEQPAAEPEGDAAQERARNERGQFAKPAGEADEPVSDADPAEGQVSEPSKASEPPTSWSADAKAEWVKLSPALQQAVLKREGEINEGGQRWSDEKKRYEEVLAPVKALAQRNGVDEREGINRLLAANDYLERDPASAIQWLAQAYGVDLGNLEKAQQDRPRADPAVSQLYQEVNSLKSTLQQREQAEINQTIESFAKAPGHEHFEDVKPLMGHLLSSGQASSLEEAYEKAAWATPSVREKLMAAQTASRGVDARTKEQQQAGKAKRAAISVSGSPSLGATPAVKRDYDTVEDAARAAWEMHAGG